MINGIIKAALELKLIKKIEDYSPLFF